MAFFTASVKAEDIKEETGGSNYINKSGIYDVTIKAAIVSANAKGARSVDFFVDYNGQDQIVYGNLRLDNNDGSANFGAAIFNKLCIIADAETIGDPTEASLPIGKGGAEKDVAILEEFSDVDVKMRVQMEYGIYQGNITEKKVIKSFYAANGATAEELVNDTEAGVQLEKDMPYAENVTYKDGLTAEQVTEWIGAKRPKGTAGGSSSTATKAPSFGKKKFGAK